MSIWTLILSEIAHRKLNFLLAFLGVAVAVGTVVEMFVGLHLHDVRLERLVEKKLAETESIMATLKAEVKHAMHRMGYNAILLPKSQPLGDWYSQDFGAHSIPQADVDRLKKTQELVDRYVPRLRERVQWDERGWTVLIVGVGQEQILGTSVCEATALSPVIPRGECRVGYELHDALDIEVGDVITFCGEEFKVVACESELGTRDDVTIWLNLVDAQRLANCPDQVNEIAVVEHVKVWGNRAEMTRRLEQVLPDCQVVELASETLSRAHARIKVAEEARATVAREEQKRDILRRQRGRVAFLLAPVIAVVCAGWVGILMYQNVKERAAEIGTFMAIGYRLGQVRTLVMSKAILLGVSGGAFGFVGGTLVALSLAPSLDGGSASELNWTALAAFGVIAQVVGITASLIGSWYPAYSAIALDPSEVLREE
jgi:putative ABC transport system permease protein